MKHIAYIPLIAVALISATMTAQGIAFNDWRKGAKARHEANEQAAWEHHKDVWLDQFWVVQTYREARKHDGLLLVILGGGATAIGGVGGLKGWRKILKAIVDRAERKAAKA